MSQERSIIADPQPDITKFEARVQTTSELDLARDPEGRLLIAHAPEIPYANAERLWESTNETMNREIDRENCQVVIMDMDRNDLAAHLHDELKDNTFGGYAPAHVFEDKFPDGEKDLRLIGEAPHAQHIYIVGSILDENDFSRVRRIADHYKHTLNARWITLVAPFLGTTRQDKNVSNDGTYQAKTLNLRAEIGGLSPFVDRYIVYEPHSYATQTFAYQYGRPLAPLSPWETVTDELVNKGVYLPDKETLVYPTEENAVIVGPDRGRNLASVRIAQHYNFPYVSFTKVRLSGYNVDVHELTPQTQEIVKDRIALSFDDEFSTFGTVRRISNALERYGAAAFAVAGVHGKFTGEWRKNIITPLLTTVVVTDSRRALSKIDQKGVNGVHISTVSLVPFTQGVLEADIQGLNFWKDTRLSSLIIQERVASN